MPSGYPHYRNAHASMEKWEPVYLNLFEVTIKPPESVDGWDWIMDNVTRIGGLDTEKIPGTVEQIYKGARRRFSAAFPDSTTADISIGFEVNLNNENSMYVYKGLRKWCDLIFDPLTGAMTLKTTYSGGPMTVSLYNKLGETFRQWIFPVIWPITPIPMMDLDYSTGSNIWSIDITFAADYWDDIPL